MMLQKYMESNSLYDLLLFKRLYFHPVHLFEDQFEGTLTEVDRHSLERLVHEVDEGRLETLGDDPAEAKRLFEYFQSARFWTTASCWHKGNTESMAMWKIYGKTKGVCICGDSEALLRGIEDRKDIHELEVRYIDRDKEKAPFPVQIKDNAYKFEEEYRITKFHAPSFKGKATMEDIAAATVHIGDYVKMQNLDWIEQVVLSPYLPSFERDVVRSVVEKLRPGTTVLDSRLRVRL